MDEEKQTPETSNDSEATGATGAQGETAQTNQGAPAQTQGAEKKIAAGVLGIVLGALGIHKFILGYTKEGVIMLLVSILGSFLVGLGPMVMWIIGLIEGIIYLTKPDEEFVATYVTGHKAWF